MSAESKKLDKTCPEPFGGKSGGWVLLQLIVAEIQLLGAASIKDGLLLLSAATIILSNTVCSTLTNKIHDGQISPIGFSLHVTSSPSLSK